MDSIEKSLISNGLPMAINCSSSQFEEEIVFLVGLAKDEIMMTTRLDTDFYNKGKVKDALKNAQERGVAITILVDEKGTRKDKLKDIAWLDSLYEEKKINMFWSREKIPHLLVVDKKHVREETNHDKDYSKAKNEIMYNMKDEATIDYDMIKIWIERSEKIEKNKENV